MTLRIGFVAVLGLTCASTSACDTSRSSGDVGDASAPTSTQSAPLTPFVASPSIAVTFARTESALAPTFGAEKTTARVELPLRADLPFSLRTERAAIRVRLLGAAPSAARVDGSLVTYANVLPRTDLIHVPSPEGTEEWFRIGAPLDEAKLSYGLELEDVAGLRLVGDVLEILDAHGDPRLRTVAPSGTDAKGRRIHGSLSVEGCAVDTSPAIPWERPVTAPGSTHCIVTARFDAAGLTYPLLVDPAWTTTAGLATKRSNFAAATTTAAGACSAGCVLAAGGVGAGSTYLSSAEVYNASAKTWASAGTVPGSARALSVAANAGSGVIVLAGGFDSTGTASKQTSWWTPTGFTALADLGYAFGNGGMASLSGFGVVLVGGSDDSGTALTNTAIFSRSTLTWVAAQPMLVARNHPFVGSAAISTGFRVCAASYGSSSIGCVEYKGAYESQVWKTPPGEAVSATRSSAAVMPDGRIVLAGGPGTIDIVTPYNFNFIGSVIVSTPAALTSTVAFNAVGTAVGSDRVIFTGGKNLGATSAYATVNIIQPSALRSSVDVMHYVRLGHQAVPLPDGSALVLGGNSSSSFGITYPANEDLFAVVGAGAACGAIGECAGSLFCADGVCCDTSCTAGCEACNLPSLLGTCSAVSGAPASGHAACGPPAGGVCGYQCNGSDHAACHPIGTGTVCNAETCGATGYTPAYTCDGAGSCAAPVGSYPASCKEYICKGTKCGTSCAANTDCASGYRCDTASSKCVTAGGLGAACTVTGDCLGFACVDGVCCGAGSCASPLKCNVPGAEGSCRLSLGTTCSAATAAQCGSGKCVDGVCCDAGCTGQCEQCKLAGNEGHCTPTPSGANPAGGRTACGGSGSCQAKCDGATRASCGPYPAPTIVCAAASCSAGKATDTSYCDGTGKCVVGAASGCFGYNCGAAACLTSCTSGGTECASGYFCSSGSCVTTGKPGTTCSTKSECASGNCVDGVCCTVASCGAGLVCNATSDGTCALPNGASCASSASCGSKNCVDGICCDTACSGQCQACDVGGKVGTCSAVSGAPHGSRTACVGTGACQAQCNGTDTTKCGSAPGTSTPCAAGKCVGSSRTDISYCDGLGTCTTPASTTCLPYTCDSTTCKAACTLATSATDCATGYACTGGVCATEGDIGTVCTDALECKSKHCVDSTLPGKRVCCSVASCDAGTFCGALGDKTPGACIKKNGATCTAPTDCSSGICVDGVCCDKTCGGQCEACNVKGAEGTCSPVTGAPAVGHGACSDGGGDVCKALACDGSKDRTKCSAFLNGIATECSRSCTDGTLSKAFCDGAGSCGAPKSSSCAGFACAGKDCKTSCAADADCTSGFSCNVASGKCEPIKSKCSPDGLQSIPADGSAPTNCAPYLCEAATGGCYATCTAAGQCTADSSCDGTHCVPAAATPDPGSSGGCALGAPENGRGPLTLVALSVLGLLAARRRRLRGERRFRRRGQ